MAETVDNNEHLWEGIPLEERPGGWPRWSFAQTRRWRQAAKHRAVKKQLWEKEILRLAKYEIKTHPHISVRDVECPPVNIEAIYGPLMGRPSCTIKVWEGKLLGEGGAFDGCALQELNAIPHSLNKLPAIYAHTRTDGLGPRRFLTKLFQVIGYFGGNAKVFMKPSGTSFDVDPDQFKEWASKPEEMLSLLSGTLELTATKRLEDHG